MESAPRAWTVVAACALAAHGALAVAWWRALPRGFPAGHPQWWANEVAPWLVIATTLAGLALLALGWRARTGARPAEDRGRVALLALAGGWAGIALGGVAVFPQSGSHFAAGPGLAALFVGLLARAGRAPSPGRSTVAWLVASAALAAGAWLATTQRGADPDTRPRGDPAPAESPGAIAGEPADLAAGRVQLQLARVRLTVEPLLTFSSCSPDRGWTLFTPGGPRRRPFALTGFVRRSGGGPGAGPADAEAWFACDDAFDATRAHLAVRRLAEGGADLEATTRLSREVYAHLDAYTHVDAIAQGGAALALVFSPCPATPIEVRHADYPVGRPMRFAYVDAGGTFRVVEATSGEKGPFHELAGGAVADDAPLEVTLLVGGEPACRITWRDFVAQAGRALSPTAGWGVPVNAIEFRLEAPGRMSLWCTLAATSVGRGYQSVGHAPGFYTNRLRVEPVR